MKKTISKAIVISMLAAMTLTGCGDNKKDDTEATSEVVSEATEAETEEDTTEASSADDADGATSGDASDKVADASEMTDVEDVVEEGMVPIYANQVVDGTYEVEVASSSSMFKIARCELTVADGEMNAVIYMNSTSYVYLFPGTGLEAAESDEASYIPFEEDEDGSHTLEFPVEALDEGIPCAAYSRKKEKWYDRTILFRADSLPMDAYKDGVFTTVSSLGLEDGSYSVEVTLSGGSGKASVESPTDIKVEAGACTATITWSSPNYDYMIVDGEKYLPVNADGNSTFEIPVSIFDRNVKVIADTTAMSEPHEIEYTLNFNSSTIK